jgi:hypothetical protein
MSDCLTSFVLRDRLDSSAGRSVERSTSIVVLLADGSLLDIRPAGQGLEEKTKGSEEESQEDKSLTSVLERDLDKGRVDVVDVVSVVVLSSEDEGSQPEIREDKVNQSNPLAQQGRLEGRQKGRQEEDDGQDGDDQVVDDVSAVVVLVDKVGVDAHGDDRAHPLHDPGDQEQGASDGGGEDGHFA